MHRIGTTLYRAVVGRALDFDDRLPCFIEEATVISIVDGMERLLRRGGPVTRLGPGWHTSREAAERAAAAEIRSVVAHLQAQADEIEGHAHARRPGASRRGGLARLVELMFGPLVGQSGPGAPLC